RRRDRRPGRATGRDVPRHPARDRAGVVDPRPRLQRGASGRPGHHLAGALRGAQHRIPARPDQSRGEYQMTTAATLDTPEPATLVAHARDLLERDRWSRDRLHEHQQERLRSLLAHAVAHSPYYRDTLGPDAVDAELEELPTLPKPRLMEQFDRVVTDPRLRLA